MFQTILDTFEYFTSQEDTVTPSSGAVNYTSGLTKRFYRAQKLTRVSNSTELQPRGPLDSVPQASYYISGALIITDPAISGASSLKVKYSYLPQRFNDLATDGTALPDYPDGHEAALIYLSAAWAMTKGDAENMTQIARLADVAVEALLTHVARLYPIGASFNIARTKAALMRNTILASG